MRFKVNFFAIFFGVFFAISDLFLQAGPEAPISMPIAQFPQLPIVSESQVAPIRSVESVQTVNQQVEQVRQITSPVPEQKQAVLPASEKVNEQVSVKAQAPVNQEKNAEEKNKDAEKNKIQQVKLLPKIELEKEKVSQEQSTEDLKSSSVSQIEGLDTVSVKEPEGNWLLKRIWWEKANKKYEKIKDAVSKIIDSRAAFFEKRNNLEKAVLNPFYTEIGLKSGQISEIVNALIERMKQEREENVTLDVKEREFLEFLKTEESSLKQIDADINGIKALDDSIDQDLTRLDEQISRSKRYEENAWQLFSAIAKELSHKKAREFYYKMDALWQNVKSIDEYIKGAFSNHFDSIIENANSQVNRIKEMSAKFKEKGVDLKKKYKEIILKKGPSEKEKQEAAKAQAEKEAKEAEEKAAQERGMLGKILDAIAWPFKKAWGFFTSFWTTSQDLQEQPNQENKVEDNAQVVTPKVDAPVKA